MEPPNGSFFQSPSTFFKRVSTVFFFHFTIKSLNSCIPVLLLMIESNKLHRRFLSSSWNHLLVREIIGYDVSITVAVFDYAHWKLHIASFLLKSLFSFFKRRGSVRPRKILITISTYTIWHYVPSSDNFTSTTSFMDANTFNKELIIRDFILQFYVEWFLSLE